MKIRKMAIRSKARSVQVIASFSLKDDLEEVREGFIQGAKMKIHSEYVLC